MKKLFCLVVLLFQIGCAAGFDNTVPVADLIQVVDPSPARVQIGNSWVRIDPFSDNREQDALIKINDRLVKPDDTVSLHVSKAFEDFLRLNNYRISQSRGPILRGELLDWFADIETGFPTSKGNARAAFRIVVIDESGVTRYSAVYKGSSSLKHPFLTESKVKRIMGEALQVAMESALKDPAFLQVIDSNQQIF